MRIAIIGRTEILYETVSLLREAGHEICLIVTSREAPEYTRTARDFQHLANQIQAEFIQTPKIEEAIGVIKSLPKIDIAVSLNYSGVIPQEVIDLFTIGILNAHGGDLPRYRGNACQAWAILNGEQKIGLCIHKMIGGELDSGNIIVREYLPIDFRTKVGQVWQWMSDRIPVLFLDAVEQLAKNPNFILEAQSKDPIMALRCYPRRPEDGEIDWQKPAIEVLRLINASGRPYAGAFCRFEEKKLIIWDASLVEDIENFLAVPGQITCIGPNYVEVACKEGKLRLFEIEYKGVTSPATAVIRSIRKRLN